MSAWEEREEDLESQLNRGSLWAIIYGDLMSYLVILFMLLYASASTKSLKSQMDVKSVEEHFGAQGKVIQELFSQQGVQKIARLEVGENKIRIVFQAPVLFDPGSAYLKDGSMPQLHQLMESLMDIPNSLQIEGHTDDRPLGAGAAFQSNWELSAARAFSVLRFMEASGIPAQRLSAIGYGDVRPLTSNGTQEGRLANRRIEINIMRRES